MPQLTSEEEHLYKIFSNVNDWLKFAEAKNAMLIAFNGASIYGIMRAFELDYVKGSTFLSVYLLVAIVCMVFSTVCSLVSFVPRLKMVKRGQPKAPTSNLLFYEYLKTKSNIEILTELTANPAEDEFSKIKQDISEQIRQNSIIASRKYEFFTIAAWLTITAYITVPVTLLLVLYTFLNDK